MIRATINGQSHEFAGDLFILDAAKSDGIDVPTLCHDPRLKPIGSCRMCLVQVEGRPHPLTSCNNQLGDGMTISTHTPALEHERRMLPRMLAQDHPADMFALAFRGFLFDGIPIRPVANRILIAPHVICFKRKANLRINHLCSQELQIPK